MKVEPVFQIMPSGDHISLLGSGRGDAGVGVEPSDVYVDFLVPALRAIGDGWAPGELTVADEHRRRSRSAWSGGLGPRFARRGRKRGTVVVGAPPRRLGADGWSGPDGRSAVVAVERAVDPKPKERT